MTGVFWSNRLGKWAAQIQVNGKPRHIGLFGELAIAVEARHKAEREYYGDFAPKRSA